MTSWTLGAHGLEGKTKSKLCLFGLFQSVYYPIVHLVPSNFRLFDSHTLFPVCLVSLLNMTADLHFVIGFEVLLTHVLTSMGHREMHDGLAFSDPYICLKNAPYTFYVHEFGL